MKKCKPVFTKRAKVYLRRPRIQQPPSSAAWLPALRDLAKAQRREVEALCRLITKHTVGAQMLHYLLRWWKHKPSIRMTEADWQAALALSKKEIRYGKQALEAAGISVQVIAHKTGRATFFSVDMPRFLKRLKSAIGASFSSILKVLGVCPMGTDGSVQRGRMGLSNGDQTVITDSSTNLSHQIHDDDLKTFSDSGEIEFSFQNESVDPQRDEHDASRKYLEEHGVKAKYIAAAAKHPLSDIERAFEIAAANAKTNQAGYALSVLENGDFNSNPAWYTPVGAASMPSVSSWQSGSSNNRPSVKTNFQNSTWEGNGSLLKIPPVKNTPCPKCGHFFCNKCHKEAAPANA